MIKSLYPYKMLDEDSVINDGIMFKVPFFCLSNCKKTECRRFYGALENDVFSICPHGFGAYITKIGNDTICFTCLNVETVSKRKLIEKRLRKGDWLPRIPKKVFLNSFSFAHDDFQEFNEEKVMVSERYKKVLQDEQLLNDSLHEIRKVNNQIKFSSTQLSSKLKYFNGDDSKTIDDIRLNIIANSDLLSIRLNAYDMVVNPTLIENEMAVDISIYKKFEKVYKCLYGLRSEKNINVKLVGLSTFKYHCREIVELAFFIIIENALKYSPPNEEVDVVFSEGKNKLEVTIRNWGLKILPNELNKLTERGYRGQMAINSGINKGSGLGLYLLSQICKDNNIDLRINIGNDQKSMDGWIYKPFIVKLIFKK